MDSAIASPNPADRATPEARRPSYPPATTLIAHVAHLFTRQETTE